MQPDFAEQPSGSVPSTGTTTPASPTPISPIGRAAQRQSGRHRDVRCNDRTRGLGRYAALRLLEVEIVDHCGGTPTGNSAILGFAPHMQKPVGPNENWRGR